MSILNKMFALKQFCRNKGYSTVLKRCLTLNVDTAFDNKVYRLHQIETGPSITSELEKAEALKLFKQMDMVRRTENALAGLYREKKIRGFCHLVVGQEAVCVGINSIMRPQDTIITSYRCHGWAVLRCESISGVIAELLGFQSGAARGKGGSMHIYGPQFFGGNGIVGAHVPLGVGIGLKHKYTNDGAVSVVLYGDGAANQGQVFEAFNIAKLLMLPVLFIVENNYYGLGTASHRSSANPEYYRTCSFLPGIRCSGMDILTVRESTRYGFKHILDGKGPIIVEMMTYRYFGHSMSDPGTSYRDRDEISSVRERKDAIQHMKNMLVESKLATPEEIKAIETENKKLVTAETEKAFKDKETPVEELTADCYKSFPFPMRVPKMHTWIPHKNIGKYGSVSK
ncbi:pyruvate dehydrogenase E1 component subunit alpha, mitochondrial-like [Sitophilus oryzae]|uniref:pyruvate dehydrogenase (acetyl-transferring) n=1 Tax=Sitophilus oryzae TaxID=7048 RepID=A0A6J2X7D7_SITOR|nr:pyruvate dehydrogenase E1 component subunit alpha, mitochondrial-like [Sitophilus oryzae]